MVPCVGNGRVSDDEARIAYCPNLGHSFEVLGLLTIPTLLFTLMVAALALAMPCKEIFLGSVWIACGIFQVVVVMTARKIRFKHNYFD